MGTREDWRTRIDEPAIEPALPIIDAHHHLWSASPAPAFEAFDLDALIADKTGGGHNVVATVYVDSHANYATEGPEHLRVVGETRFAHAAGVEADGRGGGAQGSCAAIVAHADLLLGERVGEVLDAHIAASPRFRGIRYMTAFDAALPPIYGCTEPGMMARPEFRTGAAELAKRGLSFDAWLFHPQLPELIALARALPDLRIVLDHVAGPIGVGPYAQDRVAAFAVWRRGMAELAACPNVVAKLGALNMSFTGMAADQDGPRPLTSAEMAERQRGHVLTAIDLFGADRCMFESNFPVDKLLTSYRLVWNSFKRMTEGLSASERADLFAGTAARVYRIAL